LTAHSMQRGERIQAVREAEKEIGGIFVIQQSGVLNACIVRKVGKNLYE